jgi:CubicO group peptidase (beta-lactamase class C family)
VLDTGFHAVCESAAAEWSVPALAVGIDLGDGPELLALGCDRDTRFRIASVTKPITAVLALRLLELESSTGVWPDDVRVRHLLSNTSGFDHELPDPDLGRFGDGDGALARCVAELPSVRRFVGVEQVWSYANTGFWLAGHLAARRAGAVFEDALADHVLRPAGLRATSFAEPDVLGTGAGVVPGPLPRARRPSGGLTAPVADVLRLGRALLDPELAPMRVPRGKPNGGVYGLGLFGERVGGVEVWGHPGSYGGFDCSLLVVPDRGAVFAAVSNTGGTPALRPIEDEFFRRVIGAERVVRETVRLSRAEQERFVGIYENTTEQYEVAVADDGLRIRSAAEDVVARPLGRTVFEAGSGSRVDFPLEGFGRFGSRLAERVA